MKLQTLPFPGTRFGAWVVNGKPVKMGSNIAIPVRCSCGHETRVALHFLESGRSTCCRECGQKARQVGVKSILRQLPKLSPAELKQLHQAVAESLGEPTPAAEETKGRPARRAYRQPSTKGVAQDPAAREDIIRRRQAGESLNALAQSYGLSRARIAQLCKSWGVDSPKDLRRADPAAIEAAVAAVKAGESKAAAARAAGIDPSTLRRHFKQNDIEMPTAAVNTRPSVSARWAGKVFGMWTVLPDSYEYDPAKPDARSVECRCECGTVRRVILRNLTTGLSSGCGCRARNGQRKRTPWVCAATGERFPNNAALARHLGVNGLSLIRFRNRGKAYTDSEGRVWEADLEAAVPHNIGDTWICIQTRETWNGARLMAKHLGVSISALHQAVYAGLAYPAIDGRHYCPAAREAELTVRPRHPNSGNALAPQSWLCEETGEQWSSRGQLEKHLGLGDHGLARKGHRFTAANGLTYSRLEQQEAAA